MGSSRETGGAARFLTAAPLLLTQNSERNFYCSIRNDAGGRRIELAIVKQLSMTSTPKRQRPSGKSDVLQSGEAMARKGEHPVSKSYRVRHFSAKNLEKPKCENRGGPRRTGPRQLVQTLILLNRL